MGVSVTSLSNQQLCLSAPLQQNINHKSTAFGGSLYNLAVLAGWGLIAARLDNAGLRAEIVIQESQIKYIRPVKNNFVACAEIDDEVRFKQFQQQLQRRDKARISLESRIFEQDELAVRFSGRYVVLVTSAA